MRKRWIIGAGILLLATGCVKKDSGNNGASPSLSPSPAVTATAGSSSPEASPSAQADNLKADQVADALVARQYDRIYAQMSDDFRKDVSVEDLKQGVEGFAPEVKIWKLHSQQKLNGMAFVSWLNEAGDKGLTVVTDDKDRITGLQLKPLEKASDTDSRLTKGTYALPFKGDWYIAWGGNDVLVNYHYEFDSQRYAYDILRLQDGWSYKGDPKSNESYYAFGQDIIAPGDGTIVHVTGDIPDNVPGVQNSKQPEGNYVVIDHGNGEFSHLAHLKEGSIKVKVGDRVKTGDLLGLSGNSGNSSEPHLHYQISGGVDLFQSKAIPVKFNNGLHPIQGDIVKGS